MKCEEGYGTHFCDKTTTLPKCANCDGEHINISKKWPKRPQPKNDKSAWTVIKKTETTSIREIQKKNSIRKNNTQTRQKKTNTNKDRKTQILSKLAVIMT